MSKVRFVELKELGVDVDTFYKIYRMGEEDGREDAIYQAKNIIQNYHAYIDDDVIASIFMDLEKVQEKANG